MAIEEEIADFIKNCKGDWDNCAITPNEVIVYMDQTTFYFAKDYIKVVTSNNYRERNVLYHFITNIINKYYPTAKIEGILTKEDLIDIYNKINNDESLVDYTPNDFRTAMKILKVDTSSTDNIRGDRMRNEEEWKLFKTYIKTDRNGNKEEILLTNDKGEKVSISRNIMTLHKI